MAESTTETLFVADGTIELLPSPAASGVAVYCPGTHFNVSLRRDVLSLGDTAIDRWTMPRPTLFSERKSSFRNYEVVLGYYLSKCMMHLAVTDAATQESLILAHLMPHRRSTAENQVMRDSPLRYRELKQAAKELDLLLHPDRHSAISRVEFRDRTADILGPPAMSDNVMQLYQQMSADLLGPACELFEARGLEAAVAYATQHWQDWKRRYARRPEAKWEDHTNALNVISYEIKVAFCRAYSCLWYDLVPLLERKYNLERPSIRFHDLWNLDWQGESNERDDAAFHLFHGYILGLHQASEMFLRTPTGRRLLKDWLTDDSEDKESGSFGRLLNGLMITMFHYASMYDDQRDDRRKRPEGSSDLIVTEQIQESIRRGHRALGYRAAQLD